MALRLFLWGFNNMRELLLFVSGHTMHIKMHVMRWNMGHIFITPNESKPEQFIQQYLLCTR